MITSHSLEIELGILWIIDQGGSWISKSQNFYYYLK